ncbi:Uncharacterized protein dnm_022750 [Desulfonema magnum]|uniref:Uncharacterized protein n=1 Tax=Desulfonema magnum TaxID=45655 RepID=A0A975BIE1_9BACT|nr:Uncharacterized protein dnm_022750 [Desulfonema magnum]
MRCGEETRLLSGKKPGFFYRNDASRKGKTRVSPHLAEKTFAQVLT